MAEELSSLSGKAEDGEWGWCCIEWGRGFGSEERAC